jgi:hypothetical protein
MMTMSPLSSTVWRRKLMLQAKIEIVKSRLRFKRLVPGAFERSFDRDNLRRPTKGSHGCAAISPPEGARQRRPHTLSQHPPGVDAHHEIESRV